MIKIEGINYEDLKQLFLINDKANNKTTEMFKLLKATVNTKGNDVLLLYNTSKEADRDFKKMITYFNLCNQIEDLDKKDRILKLKGGENRYFFWSLSKLKSIDGHMFKKIKFK